MITDRRKIPGLLFLSLFLLFPGAATGQPIHGEVTEVDGDTLRVALTDTLTVAAGTEGQVVQTQTVGGEEVQINVALLSVERVGTPETGPWVALCRVKRQSEAPSIGDGVRFSEVEPRPGRLVVRSEPSGASVYVDGERAGTAPIETQVESGRHEVRIEREGYESQRRTVSVQAGQRRALDVTLPALTGTLVVRTQPEGATVTVEGREVGTAPVEEELKPGSYEVRIEQEGYLPAKRTATVREGQETEIRATLRRPLIARPADRQSGPVANVRVERDEGQLVVRYDLTGEEDEYEVALLLSTDGGATFQELQGTVEGAVGEEVAPGSGKRVTWAALTDYPDGLSGDLYRLRINAEPSGGNGWLYAIGGAVLAGGGVAAAILTGLIGGDDGGFPEPPSPPQ